MTAPANADRIQEWDAVLDDANYYEILGVLPIASTDSIRLAYREFALAFHPDLHADASVELRSQVQRIFRRGAEAYRVLADPELRVRYDMGVEKGQLRLDISQLPKRSPSLAPGETRSLPDLCKTAGAKTCARKAVRAIDEGDLVSARDELKRALEFDGINPELVERLEALDVALFATGGG
ncbi:MAG: J domain-containing protein [Polyangiaceae bacterium]